MQFFVNVHELNRLFNPVTILLSGIVFLSEQCEQFFSHKTELRKPNKPNYI